MPAMIIKQCVVVLAIAACGGGAKPATTPGGGSPAVTRSECAVTAEHVANAVFTWKEPPPTTKENVAQVITERCETDQWSAEAKRCFGGITDEDSTKPCIQTLTEEQHKKVMDAMESKFDHKDHAEHDDHDHPKEGGTGSRPMPTGAPPPVKSADPCEGGE